MAELQHIILNALLQHLKWYEDYVASTPNIPDKNIHLYNIRMLKLLKEQQKRICETEKYLNRLNQEYDILATQNSASKTPSKEDMEYVKQIIKRENRQ